MTLHIGGASGIAGIQDAAMAVASGVANNVVVVSGRNGSSMHRVSQAQAARGIQAPHRQQMISMEFEGVYGANVPMQFYALIAQRHMHLYGTTSEQLGAVAVTMRRHAGMNEKAIMTAPITIDDHQASRMITTPFHLFDCCIETDGSTAVVVSSAERAADAKRTPARILGIAEGHPDSPSSTATRVDHTRIGISKAAPRAFAMAGLTPQDLKLAMLYDPFTFIPIYTLENLGVVGPGEGGPFAAEGHIGLGGRLPVNTHGGLHSQAHSQSGLNHVAEAVKQLRGIAGRAQVADPGPVRRDRHGRFRQRRRHAALSALASGGTASWPTPIRSPFRRQARSRRPIGNIASKASSASSAAPRAGSSYTTARSCAPRRKPRPGMDTSQRAGVIFSFTVSHRAFHPGISDDVPYVIAIVALEEGPRLMCRIRGVEPEEVRVGLPVEVFFEAVTPEVTLPFFRPSAQG